MGSHEEFLTLCASATAGESGADDSAGREEGCGRKGRRLMCTFLCTTPFLEK